MPIALPLTFRRFIKNVPLRWVLTIPFVLPTIGAVTLVGYLSYQNGQKAVETLGHQLVAETNERVAQELKTYLQTPLLINRLNVDAVKQEQINPQTTSTLETALFYRLQQFDQVSAILFASPQGIFRVVERLPELYPELYLGAADPARPNQLLIYRLNDQGKREQLVHTEKGLDVRRDRPWYQRAVTTKQSGWNPIFQYGSFEALTLNASQPVYDSATDRLLGVFSVNIRLDYLSQFLRRLEISRSGQVIILDQSGALIATSTQEKPYKHSGSGWRKQFQQLKIDESADPLTRSLGEYLRDRSSLLNSLNQAQYLEFSYSGEPQYVKITPFQDQYGLNWRILTVIPKSYFMGAIQANTLITALLSLLTLSIAIALSLFAAQQLTASFAQLNQISQELAAGNLNQRLSTNNLIYELNSLAQTFNQMADQLQQSFNRFKVALAESEEKFTVIFHSSPDAIALSTLIEGYCVEANEGFLDLLEYSREELIGQRLLDLEVWGNLEERDYFRQVLQQQSRVRNLEVQLVTQSRKIKTVLLSADCIEISGEIYVLGIIRDISDRKQTEESLRESEERFRRAFDDAPIGIALVSVGGWFLKVNRSLCNILGYTEAELLAKNLQNVTYASDLQACLEAMRQLLKGEHQIFQTENRYLQKQGNPIQCSLNISLVKDQKSQPLYFIAQIQDISDRKQIDRMKSEFISVVSHELRTPLTSIRGALGILGSGIFNDRPEKAQHMLQIATNNSDRLVRLVDDILSLERLESGKVQLTMELCQVADLMQQALESVQALADQSAVTLSFTVLFVALWASPDAIVQTLINLLSNAIKFSSPGDTVWLKAELQGLDLQDLDLQGLESQDLDERREEYVLFSIVDQGRGIPEDKLEVIFEQFQQVDVSDARKKGGTGLGLAICRNIVQQHGGTIWAESQESQGSTLYFTLPLKQK